MPQLKQRQAWKHASYTENPFYANSLDVDIATGLPADYLSLFSAYHKLAVDIARKQGIPAQEIEDSIQEINIKFYKNDGLNRYDKTKEFEHDGSKHTAKFGTMYQRWLFLSMLYERDKNRKRLNRYMPVDSSLLPEGLEEDIATDVVEKNAVDGWIERASLILVEAKESKLIPTLKVCADAAVMNQIVTRKHLADATKCSAKTAGLRLNKLRQVLMENGMGAESLHE